MIFTLFWLVAVPPSAARVVEDAPPSEGHSRLACGACHDEAAAAVSRPVTLSISAGQEAARCGHCHGGTTIDGHQVGARLGGAPPPGLPLDPEGRLACRSCHDLHGEAPRLLRRPALGGTLCVACHEADFFAAMADGGMAILGTAHPAEAAVESGQAPGIDAPSLNCLTCHDEKIGAANWMVSRPVGFLPLPESSEHPVGRDYARAARGGGFRAREALPEDIALPGGRVSCVSCHRPYDRRHGALRRPRGALCRSCHSL
jgi:predicted CXXCH cytochrome family protein